jgi:NDP-sugar pyrophosphorylase family protein
MLHYGDVVTDQDFRAMVDFHRAHAGLATILVHERWRSNSVVEVGAGGRVERFLERPRPAEREGIESRLVNSSVCVCDRAALDAFPVGGAADLPRDVLPRLVAEGLLYAFELTGERVAVDSEERLQELREALSSGRLSIE